MDDIYILAPSIPESPPLPLQPFYPDEEDQMPELELEMKVEPEPEPELEMKVEPEPMLEANEPQEPQERAIVRRFRVRRSERIRTRRFLFAWRASKKSKQ